MEFVFRIQKKSRNTRRASRRGHWTFLGLETKRSGVELLLTHLKANGTPQPLKMVERFKDAGHPVSKSISALNRGIPTKKNGREHFNADASNTELLFRIVHSVNRLTIYGAVSSWCEHFGLTGRKGDKENRKNP